MSNYDTRRADAYEERLRSIHMLTSSPGSASVILEGIAKLTSPEKIEDIKRTALEEDNGT